MNKEDIEVLANIRYMKVTRVIEKNVQNHREEEHVITLTTKGIETSCDTFSLAEVLDISFRDFSQQLGLLYLHTTKGMYSYTVRINPQIFIKKFKEVKKRKKNGTNSL
ncbi:hypothetical protein [Bacillus sp. J37]|uniref:hypothetical protein n=1 Tax=Bacillus sp. J37 TaxID=935837 RepID=UPI00047EDF97|nr:hypothetical protein [Bacillus sp. J37]